MIRTSGKFADVSAQCDEPHRNGGAPLPPTSGSYIACKRLLSRVPTLIETSTGSSRARCSSSTSRSTHRTAARSWADAGQRHVVEPQGCTDKTFTQVITVTVATPARRTNPTWRSTSSPADSATRTSERRPREVGHHVGPAREQRRGPAFYWPQIGDPNPTAGAHPIYSGGKARLADLGIRSRYARAVRRTRRRTSRATRRTAPNSSPPARRTAAVTTGRWRSVLRRSRLDRGDPVLHQPAGRPDRHRLRRGSNGRLDLVAGRTATDHGTLWAATSAGRIFVTHNADAADPGDCAWHRIDSSTAGASPTRFPSAIYIDPADTGQRGSYSGYNAATPATPGHAFSVSENGSTPGSGTSPT